MSSNYISTEIGKANKKITDFLEKITKGIPEKKKPVLLIITALFLIALIVLPELKKITKANDNTVISSDSLTADEEIYAQDTEMRLCELISSIDGAGKTKVFLTLECSEENVYAQDINGDKHEYVLIKRNSDQGGMLLKIIKPEIRGVAIVCEGGGNPIVEMNIIDAVSSSLGVSSARISIAKMKGRSE